MPSAASAHDGRDSAGSLPRPAAAGDWLAVCSPWIWRNPCCHGQNLPCYVTRRGWWSNDCMYDSLNGDSITITHDPLQLVRIPKIPVAINIILPVVNSTTGELL